MTMQPISTRTKTLGGTLIVIIGLLNFHLPHFVLERSASSGGGDSWIEAVFAANVLAAVVSAALIWTSRRSGWVLGVVVVCLSVVLYVAQETVGLPGLPRNWWEPSRILSIVLEILFVVVARSQVGSSYGRSGARWSLNDSTSEPQRQPARFLEVVRERCCRRFCFPFWSRSEWR